MNAWSSTIKKALGSYGSTCFLFLSRRQDFQRQEIDEDDDNDDGDDDDSTDFKMWQGSLPHKNHGLSIVYGITYLAFQ